ncbi:MAG: AI-2E family transporter YdiK [Gammaproteobacteria bacterium]
MNNKNRYSISSGQSDLTRTLLAVFFICALAGLSLWIIQPFLFAALWATMVVVATWRLLLSAQAKFGGRRAPAAALMTGALLLIFVIPFTLAVNTIADNAGQIIAWGKNLSSFQFPASPPEWLQKIPFAADYWKNHISADETGITKKITPFIGRTISWFITEAGNFGMLTMQFLLTVVITAILYASGETAGQSILRFGRRLAGDAGENAILLAAQAIRGVALGVVVTALIQSSLAGVGLFVAGIPFAVILTAVMFMLAIAQIGPLPVLAPAVGWLYWNGDSAWGTALLVWTLIVGSMDNIVRPILIKKGADLPFLLIFTGVVGGLIAFGLVGIFIGPVVLAVTYTLLAAWIAEVRE